MEKKPPIIGLNDKLKAIVDDVRAKETEAPTPDISAATSRPKMDVGLKGKKEHRSEGGCGCGGTCRRSKN